jgi:hypothetical protein
VSGARSAGWSLSRRSFLRVAFAAVAGLVAACTRGRGGSATRVPSTGSVPAPSSAFPEPFRITPGLEIPLEWTGPDGDVFDLELNGRLIASGLRDRRFVLRRGSYETGFQEDLNTWRVRVIRGGDELWSRSASFEVLPTGGIRTRRFDFEEDGPIELTSRGANASATVHRRYAFGLGGKGLRLQSRAGHGANAYANLVQLPTDECWIRLAVNPRSYDRPDARVSLCAIRGSSSGQGEHLVWRTGRAVVSSSTDVGMPIPREEWTQLQLGVLSDGTIEVWAFDGIREVLVGSGRDPALRGEVKDLVSIGNSAASVGSAYEVWLDEVAIGHRMLPWARPDDPHVLPRPQLLDPHALPETFSFVFGSCNVSTRLPYAGTALEAASKMRPDFFVHLGDFGYPDTGAYAQTTGSYLALWSDLLYEESVGQLFRVPWIYLTSDHDLGGNNVDRRTVLPHAATAFARWQRNDRGTDPDGRYGSLELDGGRILLLWLEGIAFRSPLEEPDGPRKTMLGPDQKAWLLRMLRTTRAGLIVVLSQTSFGHDSGTGWSRYGREQREVLAACHEARGTVRWLSGDHHTARWARVGGKVAEWGAAPLAEVVQGLIPPLDFVSDDVCLTPGGVRTREFAIANHSRRELEQATSFGRVVVDTARATATFEVRDNRGEIRVAPSGFRMVETIRYG